MAVFGTLSNWLIKHAIIASVIVLVCSIGPRVFLVSRADPNSLHNDDAMIYLALAHNLQEREAFLGMDDRPEIARTPGYPAFLAILMFLFGKDLRVCLLAQAVVFSFGVLILYWIATRILPPVAAFWAGLLAAFSPWSAVLAGLPLSDGLFLLILVVILFFMRITEEAESFSGAVFGCISAGLFTGMAVLIRPFWPLVVLIAVCLYFLYGPNRKRVWLIVAIMLFFAIGPLYLWTGRNQRESAFAGLSDISGKTAWRYLASRVQSQVTGGDRFALKEIAMRDDQSWEITVQQADDERWHRANAVFRKHPILTIYCFLLSAVEHATHPSPDVLRPARLNFMGDFWVFALLWGGLLTLSCLGLWNVANPNFEGGEIDRRWLLAILVICLFLTLSSGLSFGAGSRLRAPLELIVPLLAAPELLRLICVFHNSRLSR